LNLGRGETNLVVNRYSEAVVIADPQFAWTAQVSVIILAMTKCQALQLRLSAEVVLSIIQKSPNRATMIVLIDHQYQTIKITHSECAVGPNDFPLFCVP
jgi:hypothetical protein